MDAQDSLAAINKRLVLDAREMLDERKLRQMKLTPAVRDEVYAINATRIIALKAISARENINMLSLLTVGHTRRREWRRPSDWNVFQRSKKVKAYVAKQMAQEGECAATTLSKEALG